MFRLIDKDRLLQPDGPPYAPGIPLLSGFLRGRSFNRLMTTEGLSPPDDAHPEVTNLKKTDIRGLSAVNELVSQTAVTVRPEKVRFFRRTFTQRLVRTLPATHQADSQIFR